MNQLADLELALYAWDPNNGVYRAELRFSQPDSDVDVRREGDLHITLQLDELQALHYDQQAYGAQLGAALFSNPRLQELFSTARALTQRERIPLRLRLLIGADAPELHAVRWETLRHPDDGALLLTGEQVLFSRYLTSQDWRHAGLRLKGELRALVAIANPDNLTSYAPGGRPLAAIDVAGELARIRAALGRIATTELASGGSASLARIMDALRGSHYDILYLVCHGALIQQSARLWLEDEQGQAATVSGVEFATRIGELASQPQLVVLASCQSAGSDGPASCDEGALAAVGPRLAAAGIPAVVAMQGNVFMRTVEQFMPVFFRELERDGQIDRAMAVARGAVRDQADYWAPALFMRLKSGRIWYVPGIGKGGREFEQWDALLVNMRSRRCTPILGSGLNEHLFGSTREIARRWAEKHAFPLAQHDREDLPRVAEYLAVYQRRKFLLTRLAEALKEGLSQQVGRLLPPEHASMRLQELLSQVGAALRREDPADPYGVLARLPCPIYITTNVDNLLAEALLDAGKEPQVMLYPWNQHMPDLTREELQYQPDEAHPLVFHLFGHFKYPESLVLTEGDYFDYLLSLTRKSRQEVYPRRVQRALTDTGQLFLGFHPEDWMFRVLLRSIRQEGSELLKDYAHVAAQIDPESGRILEPERARRFMESYFQGANISVYWGSAHSFLKHLADRWEREPDKSPPPLF